ncbi:MAG TPA: anhydro-N-acetylmuramic acid kinase, partial [Sulfurimonas sp.]|nr:anhydro-N-acetylmuramic acid kinase [Sulfurimonas sp.]
MITYRKDYRAIGLMSGTSIDGIDVAYLESNGVTVSAYGGWSTHRYANDFKNRLRGLILGTGNRDALEEELTLLHWSVVRDFLKRENLNANEIDLIGFHGHTINHEPAKGRTVQIGDGAL